MAAPHSLVRIELPMPPSVNNLYATGKRGRYRTPAYDAWFAMACLAVKDGHRKAFGPYSVHIAVRRPDRRRRDLGNVEKAVSDFLVANGIVRDDSLAERITLQWDAGLTAECVVIVQPCEAGVAA